jgi:rhodanese-related sulfurtransferase
VSQASVPDATPAPASFAGIVELLAAARAGLRRLDADQAIAAVAEGALIVDIRPAWQRAVEGEISGALIVERNHLEWRLDPRSDARLDCAAADQHWIVACSRGYTSSLAAASLVSIGLQASDLAGGVLAWRAAGHPVVPGITRAERFTGSEPSVDFGELGGPHVEDEPAH